jgi:hypothetical protein
VSTAWLKAVIKAAEQIEGRKPGELKGTFEQSGSGKYDARFLFVSSGQPIDCDPGVGDTVEEAVIDALLELKANAVNEQWRGR